MRLMYISSYKAQGGKEAVLHRCPLPPSIFLYCSAHSARACSASWSSPSWLQRGVQGWTILHALGLYSLECLRDCLTVQLWASSYLITPAGCPVRGCNAPAALRHLACTRYSH